MKKIKVIIFGLIFILFISIIIATDVVKDISVSTTTQCKEVSWKEQVDTHGTCSYNTTAKICIDEPINASCQNVVVVNNYNCITKSEIVTRTKNECEKQKYTIVIDNLLFDKTYEIDYTVWGKCTYTGDIDKLIIICDSLYDGNGDGICQSGESCIQYQVSKSGVITLMKNSNDDFLSDDKSFYLEKLAISEIP